MNGVHLRSFAPINKEKGILRWGLCPHTPGIYRFTARIAGFLGGRLVAAPPRWSALPAFRPLDRRSGRIPALPYPPTRSDQYRPICDECELSSCRRHRRQGINGFLSCLNSFGRF